MSARRVRNDSLGDAARLALGPGWHPSGAAWWGTSHRLLSGHTAWLRTMIALPRPDGNSWLASAGGDAMIRIWDTEHVVERGVLEGHEKTIEALAAVPRPDGTCLLVSASSDGTARVWDAET
nr:hypothetical protein [Micromonospora sp. DSM 115978]